MKRLLSILGAVLSLAAWPAAANIVFTFDGAMFDDGGTLTGTFTTNDAITTLLDYDITTAGGTIAGFHYTPLTADFNASSLPAIIVVEPSDDNDPILQVTFTGLTSTGGTILIGNFDSFEQSGTTHRNITAGQATVGTTTVAEPSTALLLAISAAGLLAGLRRRGSR